MRRVSWLLLLAACNGEETKTALLPLSFRI